MTMDPTRSNERGIALVFTLFLMASLSALAVSLMFLSQTETASTRNYRTMSQARYAGEAGVHKALNFLSTSTYTPPSTFANYNLTVSPVTCVSGCPTVGPVVLSGGVDGVTSNYPQALVTAAFSAAVQGTLATNVSGTTTNAALGTVTYGATARLMSMRRVTSYGGGTGTIQTWEITAVGRVPTLGGAPSGTVEVTAVMERQLVDAQTFAVFATGTGCGAIDLGGTVETKSYDSRVSGSAASPDSFGGNVGTNGNMTIGGNVGVHGSLTSPRKGVGACVNGSGVTALTTSGKAVVDNMNLVELPQPLNFETPALPNPMPPTANQNSAVLICAAVAASVLTAPAATCTGSNPVVIDPMGGTVVLGNIGGNLTLKGGNYIINSLASSNITLGTSAAGGEGVVINLAGKTSTGTDMAEVWDQTSQDIVNTSMKASNLQIIYAGTGKFDMHGGATSAYMLYAPNATVETHGNGNIYGSILTRFVMSRGTPEFIYDRSLDATAFTMGNFAMTSFSWKKY